MKAIVVFLAKQKNYGLVLVMQRFPPKQRGSSHLCGLSFEESGQDIGFEIFHRIFERLGGCFGNLYSEVGPIMTALS